MLWAVIVHFACHLRLTARRVGSHRPFTCFDLRLDLTDRLCPVVDQYILSHGCKLLFTEYILNVTRSAVLCAHQEQVCIYGLSPVHSQTMLEFCVGHQQQFTWLEMSNNLCSIFVQNSRTPKVPVQTILPVT